MTKTSKDITAGMVMVNYEQNEQLAFKTWMDIRLKRAQEWENESNATTNSFQSEAHMIESIAVDEEMVSSYFRETPEDLTVSLQGFEDF